MSEYEKKQQDVVTIYGRKQFKPALEDTRPLPSTIPQQVYFLLPNGESVTVDTRSDIIIGRQPREEDPPVTVDLERFKGHQEGVSRHHALIKLMKDALILVDLDSINGTFVNGRRALPLKRYALMDGDEITVGRLVLKLVYKV